MKNIDDMRYKTTISIDRWVCCLSIIVNVRLESVLKVKTRQAIACPMFSGEKQLEI